jgi:hypothetical protein
VIGLAFSASVTVAAWHLTRRVLKGLGPGTERLTPSLIKIAVGAAVAVGALTFLAVEALWKAPEVAQITGGLSHLGDKARHTFAGVTHD